MFSIDIFEATTRANQIEQTTLCLETKDMLDLEALNSENRNK